jgi:hypothetical protein
MAKKSSCAEIVRSGKAPTDTCLRAAAAHVAHDLDLIRLAWDQRHTRLGWTQWFLAARSLYDFFFVFERKVKDRTKSLYADDILAADYLPPGQWKATAKALKAEEPREWKATRVAANKLSAHLTYSRLEKKERGSPGPSQDVQRFIGGVAYVWLSALPPERRVWFGAA